MNQCVHNRRRDSKSPKFNYLHLCTFKCDVGDTYLSKWKLTETE